MATTKNITMKQFNGTDYDTLYPKTNVKQVENLTPSSIGAVAKTGDTMTGNLNIQRDYPQVTMNSPLAGRDSYIAYVGNEKNLFLMNRLDANNRQGVYITPETSSLSNALRLMRVVDGNASYYNFIHTGNLSDLGVSRIATGSYTGTGTYGESNPNTLTFSFEPKLVIVWDTAFGGLNPGYESWTYSGVIVAGGDRFYPSRSQTTYYTVSGKSVSWYNGSGSTYQLNGAGDKFKYIAIG